VRQSAIEVTGNTGIDAMFYIRGALQSGRLQTPAVAGVAHPQCKLLLVTAHRRESFGKGMQQISRALHRIAARGDVHILFPVHPNPNVRETMAQGLSDRDHISLCEPLDYASFVAVMERAYFLITDSGGVQEEAPSLGKPVLVLREKTERPEAVDAGTAVLVGTDEERIVQEATILLDNAEEYRRRALLHNPYGDGQACERILARIAEYFERGQ
jgi:UDP-N-acetylglucosamine 2-epimerase (non-hydrolysing)